MNISVNVTKLDAAVKRQLAVIGKRAVDKDGSPKFSDITPSSAEIGALHDYYTDAATLLNTTSQYFVTASIEDDGPAAGNVTLLFPTNHNNAMNTTITVAFSTFLVAYAVYAWLSITDPALTERYEKAMREKLEAILQLIFHKAPPQSSYTYDLPPVVNTPGDITLSSGGQYLLGYTLGSDGVDDLVATSSSEAIVVTKVPNNRLFSIYNGNVGETNITGTVTIKRSDNSVLATINVTAKAPAADAAIVTHPALIGYSALSDTITLRKDENINIYFTGNITNITANNDNVSYTLTDSPTKVINIQGDEVGTSVVTIYDNAGWRYTLYVTVEAVVGVSPYFTSPQHVGIVVGETTYITYNLGDETLDDFYVAERGGNITITKDAANRRFVVTGISAGGGYVRVQSSRHPESNTVFMFVVNSTEEAQLPDVYGYTSGDTINMVAGASPVRIYFFPGSEGTFDIAPSVEGKVSLSEYDGMGYVDVTPLEAGNITLTFANQGMIVDEQNNTSWSFTLTIAVAARPAVVTNPVIYWPSGLRLLEKRAPGFNTAYVDYELGNDGVDNIVMTSSDTNILEIAKHDSGVDGLHYFTLRTVNHGTATVHIVDTTHGIDRYEMVEVAWVAPELLDLVDGEELTVPEVYNPGDNPSSDHYDHNNPTIGTDGLEFQFAEASSGNTTITVYPSERVHVRVTSTNSNGVIVKNVTIFALQEGVASITLANGTWSSRLILRIGANEINNPTQVSPTLPNIFFSQNSFSVTSNSTTGKPTLQNANNVTVHYSSSNTSVATVNETTGELTIVGNGYCYIYATSEATSRFLSQTAQYGLSVNIQQSQNNSIQLLPSSFDNEDRYILYYKGTIGDITNPVFAFVDNQITPGYVYDGATRYIAVFDEQNNAYSSDEVGDISTLISTIISAFSTNYGLTVTEYDDEELNIDPDDESMSLPEYYVLPAGSSSGNGNSGGGTWSNLSEFSSSASSGYYVVKGRSNLIVNDGNYNADGGLLNAIVYINMSNHTVACVKDGSGTYDKIYGYNESTGAVSASIYGAASTSSASSIACRAAIKVASEEYGVTLTMASPDTTVLANAPTLSGYLDGTDYE